MSKSILTEPRFNDEAAAYAWVEARLWAKGRICPHCGVVDRSGPLKGKTNRIGLYKCYACRKPFSVKVGTIFESSHIAMRDWLAAIHLVCSAKKGISANQLHRTLGITLKSAWFMAHRIREAMKPSDSAGPLGGAGKVVEADETFLGRSPKSRPISGRPIAILSLIERGASIRSMPMKSEPNAIEIMTALRKHVAPESRLHTDGATYYRSTLHPGKHETMQHTKGEYVRGDVHTNSLEGFFSIFKRGLVGVYQIMSEQHLHRYCHEFDFRHSNRVRLGINDAERAERLLKGVVGRRLTYRTTNREVSQHD
jgi:transposase-like protein